MDYVFVLRVGRCSAEGAFRAYKSSDFVRVIGSPGDVSGAIPLAAHQERTRDRQGVALARQRGRPGVARAAVGLDRPGDRDMLFAGDDRLASIRAVSRASTLMGSAPSVYMAK
jgi:hypothetical protein